jgi:hypothetical protein
MALRIRKPSQESFFALNAIPLYSYAIPPPARGSPLSSSSLPETNGVATCGEHHIVRAGAGLLTNQAKGCRNALVERTSAKHRLVRETARGLIDDEAAPALVWLVSCRVVL